LRADLALALSSLLWGATFVVVKNALDHASVFLFFCRVLQRYGRADAGMEQPESPPMGG